MLEEKILNDYKEAMKQRDSIKSSCLSFLRAEMMNVAMAKKKSALDDTEAIGVIKKQIKQRQDSIEQFTKGNRPELAEKESKELVILKAYLPPELFQEEIKKIIAEAIAATSAQGLKDMGKVMKEVNAQVSGRADGKVVSDLVREHLYKMTTDNRPHDSERRKHRRVRVSFIVFYRPNQPLHVRMMVGDKEVHAIMHDISEGGMGIVTNYNIPTGTTLSIKFILYNETAFDNNQRVKPMEMEGEVRYNIPGEHGEHRLGVSFTNISEENKAAINSFVRMVK